jgi:SNF2 family DNA or RNA helicase
VRFHRGIRDLAEALRTGGIAGEPALREDIASTLRPYQREALKWFGLLSRWGLAGILADEMGLGKTLMALAHFFGREGRKGAQDGGPVLVVCPSSLVFNWLDESRRFFPDVHAEGLHGLAPAERTERIRMRTDLLVTSYALLRRDRELLESREFRAVVLDEAQHIKNPESQTARAACALTAPERWSLTGTPVENHLGELWSLFEFLMPGFLGTRAEFEKRHASRAARGEAPRRLRDRVRPFILRRTKQQVLSELPPRIEQTERVPMTDAQRRVYETFLLRARGELEGVTSEKGRFQILAALTRLRQVCCHPALVLEPEEARGEDLPGGKFDLLRELLGECLEEGHRVLLYSQFTSMLDLMEGLLDAMEIPRCRLDGSTRNREAVVREFTGDDSIPVFLISLKAGGLGLNLTEADTVILYDPWWNPAVEAQAAARAHRIGQTVPVHVHKLITQGTVEEKILDLQARKRDLARAVVEADSDEDALSALSVDELRSVLFED